MPEAVKRIEFYDPSSFLKLAGGVDVGSSTIKGVSLITGDMTAKGHDLYVDDTTIRQLFDLAKTAGQIPVTLEHTGGIKDVNGFIHNFRIDGKKLRGDWVMLENHTETPVMLERAQKQPGTFGLSVAFEGPPKGVPFQGKNCARAKALLSVDCVKRAAANPGGLFSENDNPTIDNQKSVMTLEDLAQQMTQMQTTLQGRIDQLEQQNQALTEHVEAMQSGGEGEGQQLDPNNPEHLEYLNQASDQELEALGITREDVGAAIDQYNAELGGEGGEGQGEGASEGEGQLEGAGVGSEGGFAPGTVGAEFSALKREIIALKSARKREIQFARQTEEEIQFAQLEQNIISLQEQRDRAIEIGEVLFAENEALNVHLRTGTRPVAAGVDNGVRMFSANENGELHQFQINVKTAMTERKCSEGAAVQFCQKENPALHLDWLESQRKR